MVLVLLWSECHLPGLNCSAYLERQYGPTSAWRWGGPDTNLMRMPDQLVFQS